MLSAEPAIKDSQEVLDRIEAQRGRPVQPNVAIDGGPGVIETIEFRNVDFHYVPGQPVLAGFNLTVAAGQTIALVGPTGGGKSTIVGLMCRFYEPTAGAVLINGADYRTRSLHWLQYDEVEATAGKLNNCRGSRQTPDHLRSPSRPQSP